MHCENTQPCSDTLQITAQAMSESPVKWDTHLFLHQKWSKARSRASRLSASSAALVASLGSQDAQSSAQVRQSASLADCAGGRGASRGFLDMAKAPEQVGWRMLQEAKQAPTQKTTKGRHSEMLRKMPNPWQGKTQCLQHFLERVPKGINLSRLPLQRSRLTLRALLLMSQSWKSSKMLKGSMLTLSAVNTGSNIVHTPQGD